MFHASVQRFDGMDEKFLDGELNRAYKVLFSSKFFLTLATVTFSFVYDNYYPIIE